YWTEPNKSHSKMRFEMEKTWDLGRRLKRWSENETGFNKKTEAIKPIGENVHFKNENDLKDDNRW
ncbi:MAG: hypothetical protein LBT24_01510, partial [Tannerella sp.]|nr:hypothetical protein [Tannerella sp.]